MLKRLVIKFQIMIFLLTLLITGISWGEENLVKIGVLAYRGAEQCLKKWSPTAEYLSVRIPGKTFVIIPLDHEQTYTSVEKKEVDFILANSNFYVELEHLYEANRIATLKNRCLDSFYAKYWGAVFWKADRNDMQQLNDLKGKTFMATTEDSLGGWMMAWREFKEKGIDPYRDFKDLKFTDTGIQDDVVYAVRDGKADAGTVRSDTLIRMHAEGKIDLKNFYVVHEHGGEDVDCPPFPHSTRGYPEWPMAKLKHTPDELAKKVAIALVEMPADLPAAIAAKCGGWTIPMNYQSVHECLKYLKVGCYRDLGKITIADVIRNYWRWILLAVVLFLIMTGFSIAIIILNRNIKASYEKLKLEVDERIKTEEALREASDYLNNLIRYASAPIIVWDPDLKITRFNRAFEHLTGYKADEVVGKRIEILFSEATSKESMSKIALTLIDEHWESIEIPVLCKDGQIRIALWNSANIYAKDGTTLIATIAQGIDITERKQSEDKERQSHEALRKSEEFNKRIIENSIDCITILDLDGRLEFMSQGGQKLLDIEDISTYLNQPWIDLLTCSDDSYKAALEAISKAKERGTGHFSVYCPTVKGSPKWWDTIITPIMGKDGKVERLLSVSRDITRHESLEAQLRQAQKMEAIGTLTGGIAHDFNNLLTVIIGNAQLALMKVIKDESLRKQIEEIKKAGERAASLTRQLLAFSRKQIIKPEVLDLNEEIHETEKMLNRMIGEDIEFLLVLEPELWKIHTDPGQINQVLMNLAVNARDAMPRGGKLTIETANVELDRAYFQDRGVENEPGSYAMLAVSDTGIGMDKETQEHIFDPFFTTKEVDKGAGLGLSTVYGIVKQNNGFICVYSEPGQGTTFKLYLPKLKWDAESGKKEQTPVVELAGSEIVLIVEDDDGLRKFAQEVLLLHGYRVLDAENGEDALRVSQAHEGQIDLLLTDVVMPKMGGKELAERLQSLYPQMKVIYMSGYTDNTITHHGVLEPGLNFIEKPFSLESLAKKVRQVLDDEKK